MPNQTIEPPAGYRLMLPEEKPNRHRGDQCRWSENSRVYWETTRLGGVSPVSHNLTSRVSAYATKIIPPENYRLMLPTETPVAARGDMVLQLGASEWSRTESLGWSPVSELLEINRAYAYATKLPTESPLESARQTAAEALKSGVGVKEAMNAHCAQQASSDFLEDAVKVVNAAEPRPPAGYRLMAIGERPDKSRGDLRYSPNTMKKWSVTNHIGDYPVSSASPPYATKLPAEEPKVFPPNAGEVLSEVSASPPSPTVSACLSAMSSTLEPWKTPPPGFVLLPSDQAPALTKHCGDWVYDAKSAPGGKGEWRPYLGDGTVWHEDYRAFARPITPGLSEPETAGLRPRREADKARAIEVIDAMGRFVSCDRQVPIEWESELTELLARLRGVK